MAENGKPELATDLKEKAIPSTFGEGYVKKIDAAMETLYYVELSLFITLIMIVGGFIGAILSLLFPPAGIVIIFPLCVFCYWKREEINKERTKLKEKYGL
jgi:hypothetical protein